MNPMSPRPVCAACGDRIGMYEPLWLQKDDGTVVSSALLELGSEPGEARMFHSGCLTDAAAAR